MKTRVEELPDNRVRLEVEVPEAEVKHALEHAASDLAGSLKVPGFRKGRVPIPVVVARVGREALWQEAVRGHIESWYWSAAATSGIRPVAAPDLQFDLPADGGPFRFTATVAVAPKPKVADWRGLEVPGEEPEIPADLVEAELDALRASVAELVPVAGRPVREGDTVVLDLVGDETGTQRDYVADVGEGRLIEPLENALLGMSAGETKEVELDLGEGRTATVAMTVKDVKQRVLPELDDELAKAASEFDTLAELRADIEERLREQVAAELEGKFRESAVDALVDASEIAGAEPLVERRAAELWAGLRRSLERRGVAMETYVAMSGQSEQDLIARVRAEAERAVKRELVLDAVAEQLGIEVSDEEVETLIRAESAADGDVGPDEAVRVMRERGGFDQLRGDLRLKKALDEIVRDVKRIPVDLARAREKLWTPEKEKAGSGMKIWTPGSEEARTR